MKKLLLTLLMIFFFISCRKESDGWQIYRIYQGQHKCNGWRTEIKSSKLEEFWKFDYDCLYNPNNENDINKLTGLGAIDNQKNSIRIGWRSINDKIQLTSYIHNNGDTEIIILDSVFPDRPFYVRVEYINNKAELQIDNKILIIDNINKPDVIFLQNPYFGGQCTAPHDMTLYVKQI